MPCQTGFDPRGALLEASWSADRGRWLQQGATRTPALKQPKLSGPGALAARHRGLLVAGRTGGANRPGLSRSLQRWIGVLRESKAPERSVHRGSLSIRLQTPRAGRWRNGGLADYQTERRFFEKHRSASVSRETEARGSDHDPGVPRRPRFCGASRCITRTKKPRRENEDDCANK